MIEIFVGILSKFGCYWIFLYKYIIGNKWWYCDIFGWVFFKDLLEVVNYIFFEFLKKVMIIKRLV